MVLILKKRNCIMTEKKEIIDESLKKTAGGTVFEKQIHSFKCSCGKIVTRGNDTAPKFPCPNCMKREWEYIGCTSFNVNTEEPAEKDL